MGFTVFVLIIYLCIYSVILCNPRNSTTPTGCNVVFLYQIIIKIITILMEQIEQVLPQKGLPPHPVSSKWNHQVASG